MPATEQSPPALGDPELAALEQAKLAALYQFAYGLSHEINNPLANIAMRAQTLLIEERDPARRKMLEVINQQAFRAHEMIADLMLFARPPALELQTVDLAQLADQVVADFLPAACQQSTALARIGDATGLTANVDPKQLAAALGAIVKNALEAVKTGGRVEVEIAECGVWSAEKTEGIRGLGLGAEGGVGESKPLVSKAIPPPHFPTRTARRSTKHFTPNIPSPIPQSAIPTPHFLLSITDTGPGIPAEIRPHIFDPFFSGREAGRGLGLGLSKAWRIVQLHGGELHVESPATGGARFTIAIPRSPIRRTAVPV